MESPATPDADAPRAEWAAWLAHLHTIPNANPWVVVAIHRAKTAVQQKGRDEAEAA